MTRIETNLINNLQVMAQIITECHDRGYNMTIKNLMKHLKHSCHNIWIACPLGCGVQFEPLHAIEHFALCENKVTVCTLCNQPVEQSGRALHSSKCLPFVKCLLAKITQKLDSAETAL